MLQSKDKIRPVTYGLALYFLLVATDCFRLGSLGSFLKIAAFIPLFLALLDLRQLRIHFGPLMVVQFLFWLLALLSIFYTVNQERTIASVLTLTLNLLLVFALGAVEEYSDAEVHFLFRAMLLGSWLTAVLMLIFADVSADGRISLRLGADVQDQNYINGYILFAFSYHCDMLLNKQKKWHLLPAILLLGLVLLTGSRGAFLAFAAVAMMQMLMLLLRSDRPARNILLLVVVCVISFFSVRMILGLLPPKVAMRFSWDYISQTGTIGRTRIWNYLLEHFKQDTFARMLFGHGYGTSGYINQLNRKVAHNLYLDNLITLGIVGLALQLLTQFVVMILLIRQKNKTLLGTYVGLLVMCLSLSLVAYKPIWNVMMMALIMQYRTRATSDGA